MGTNGVVFGYHWPALTFLLLFTIALPLVRR